MVRRVEALVEVSPGVTKPQLVDLDNAGNNVPQTTAGIGSVPAASVTAGVSVVEQGDGVVHKTVFTLDASITMTDATTAGCHGALQLYDFPQGNIVVLGSSSNLSITAGAGGITDTAAVVGSVGTVTVGTGDATLTTTEADLIASTAATLSGGVGAFAGQSTAVAVFDGTATAKDAFLNFAVPDAGSSASDTLAVTGTVTIVWVSTGDN